MRYLDVIGGDLPHGLWLLDEPSGATLARCSAGKAGVATYIGSPTLGVRGPSGAIPRAISTDGVNDEVQLPATMAGFASGVPQTWEIWANSSSDLHASSGGKTLFGAQDATFQGLGIGGDYTGSLTNEVVTVGNDRGGVDDRTGWSGPTIVAGWHHHALVYNGSQHSWRYFLDGAEWEQTRAGVSKLTSSGGAFGLVGTAVTFTLSRHSTAFYGWAGLAAAAVYTRALTPAMIARHYCAGRNGGHPRLGSRFRR